MTALPPNAMGWTVEQVKQWAVAEVGIDAQDADQLVKQKIDGRALHTLTEAKLERWGIPGGPAGLLMEKIEGLGGGGGWSSVAAEPPPSKRRRVQEAAVVVLPDPPALNAAILPTEDQLADSETMLTLPMHDGRSLLTEAPGTPVEINETVLEEQSGGGVMLRCGRRDMLTALRALIERDKSSRFLLSGTVGGGKSLSLVTLGSFARAAGCLVVFMQAKFFTSATQPLGALARAFLRSHVEVPGHAALLKCMACDVPGFPSLFDLVSAGAHDVGFAVSALVQYIEELKVTTRVPVVFIIDQLNAFLGPHKVKSDDGRHEMVAAEEDPIGDLFAEWNTFSLARGIVAYALSSSFAGGKMAREGNWRAQFDAKHYEESELVRALSSAGVSDDAGVRRLVGEATGCVPREVTRLLYIWRREGGELEHAVPRFNAAAQDFFEARYESLLATGRGVGGDSDAAFSAELFLGGGQSNKLPSDGWRNSGLVSSFGTGRDRVWRVVCPPAWSALKAIFLRNDGATARVLDALRAHEQSVWVALEVALVARMEDCVASSKDGEGFVCLPCTDLRHESADRDWKVRFSFESVVRLASPTRIPDCGYPPGTFVVLWRGAEAVDCVVFSMEKRIIYLQISLEPYTTKKAKGKGLDALFSMRVQTAGHVGKQARAFYRSMFGLSDDGSAALSDEETYAYITTDTTRKQRLEGSDERVHLLSGDKLCDPGALHKFWRV